MMYHVAKRYALIKSVDVGYNWEEKGMPDLDEANITVLNVSRNEFITIAKTLDSALS